MEIHSVAHIATAMKFDGSAIEKKSIYIVSNAVTYNKRDVKTCAQCGRVRYNWFKGLNECNVQMEVQYVYKYVQICTQYITNTRSYIGFMGIT